MNGKSVSSLSVWLSPSWPQANGALVAAPLIRGRGRRSTTGSGAPAVLARKESRTTEIDSESTTSVNPMSRV
jgi:hypothetical protein